MYISCTVVCINAASNEKWNNIMPIASNGGALLSLRLPYSSRGPIRVVDGGLGLRSKRPCSLLPLLTANYCFQVSSDSCQQPWALAVKRAGKQLLPATYRVLSPAGTVGCVSWSPSILVAHHLTDKIGDHRPGKPTICNYHHHLTYYCSMSTITTLCPTPVSACCLPDFCSPGPSTIPS